MIASHLFNNSWVKLANQHLVVNKKEPPGDGWRLFWQKGMKEDFI
jgi:hypothetical protein